MIVPGYTFIASMSSIIWARAVPNLGEVDRTLNLDPVDVRRKITPRTKAIMVVHMLGNPARMDRAEGHCGRAQAVPDRRLRAGVWRELQRAPGGLVRRRGHVQLQHNKTITSGEGEWW